VSDIEKKEFANRLASYADSVAAFSFLQAAALGYALINRDFKAILVAVPSCIFWIIVGFNAFVSCGYFYILNRCHAGEDDLSPAYSSDDCWACTVLVDGGADSDAIRPPVERFYSMLQCVRAEFVRTEMIFQVCSPRKGCPSLSSARIASTRLSRPNHLA
jgi:hypothetical protein